MTQAVERLCPVCGASDRRSFLEKGSLHLVQCAGCAMVYANPVEEDLVNGGFYQQLARPFYLAEEKLASDYAAVRYERELAVFRRFCRAGRVLDVGCSTGGFLFQLERQHPGAYETIGTDVTGEALDYAEKQGITVARGSFLELAFEHRFDAVTFWAVLEHLAAPRAFFARAVELLKPGGYCFILVPNLGSLAVRLLRERYRYIMPEHLNYFTGDTLTRFANSEPVMQIRYRHSSHFNPLVIWQDARRHGRERVPDAQRARLLRRTTRYKENPWLRPVKWGYQAVEKGLAHFGLADNLVLVAQKRS